MMNNAWKINEGDRTYGKGWSNKDESPNKSAAQNYGGKNQATAAGQRPGTSSQQNYSRPQTGSRPGPSNTGYSSGNNIFGTSSSSAQQQQ